MLFWQDMADPQKDGSVKIDLRIQSHNAARPTPQLIELIEQHPDDLVKYLNTKFKDLDAAEITVTRQPAFSIGLTAIAVEFVLGMAHGAGEVVGKAIAEAIAEWIQETYHDVEIIQLHLSDGK
jgi:hypothetical protein